MTEESSNTRSTAPGSSGAALGGPSGLIGPKPVDVDAQHLLRTGAFDDGAEGSTRAEARPGMPRHIGHYRILGELGRGGFGVVYEGVHRALRFGGAIKVLKPRGGEGVAAWNEEEFLLEAARLARLREHEGIVRILDYGVHRDASGQRQPYFVMDLVPGGSEARLTTYARRVGLDVFGKLHLMAKVCDAVEHAHKNGLLHLDLKPGNILVWPRGLDGTPHQPKVIDLGIAQAMEPVADRATKGSGTWVAARPKARSGVRGTYAYMSPEQTLEGSELDRRSDVYSLGVVLYELLCGRLPVDLSRCTDGDTMLDVVREAPADFDNPAAAELPESVRAILKRAMAKDVKGRYASAAELAADLRRVLGGHVPEAARPGVLRLGRAWVGRVLGRWPALAAVLAVVAATVLTRWVVVPQVYAWGDWGSRYDSAMVRGTSEAFGDVVVVDLEGADARRILGAGPRPVEPRTAAEEDGRLNRLLLARLLSAMGSSTEGLPSVVVVDLILSADRGSADAELAKALATLGERVAVVQAIDGWRFDGQGLPVSAALAGERAMLAPGLVRATRRFGSSLIDETTPGNRVPTGDDAVLSLRYDVVEEQADAEPSVSLALAAAAARWQQRLLPQVEVVQDLTSQGVRMRFFGEGSPGAVRQFVAGTERVVPVTTVDSGPDAEGYRSARLILAVPEDAALARSTVKATTVLSGDPGTLRRLAGRVVLISHTGLDAKWPVAGGRMVPGLYIHAAATQVLLSGQTTRGPVVSRPSIAGGWVILLGAACVGAVLPGVARRVRPWGHGRQLALSSGIWLGAAIGIVVVALVGAAKFSYVVMPAVPLAAMSIAGIAAMAMQGLAFRAVRS